MSDIRLRPRSVIELIDAAFTLYRRDIGAYILAGAVSSVPYLGSQLVFSGNPREVMQPGGFLIFLVLMLASVVSFSLMTGVVIRASAEVYLGGEADIVGALRKVLPRLPGLIGSAFLKSMAIGFSMLFFLLPALYVTARWFAVQTVIVLEDADVMPAFTRSSFLSRGRKWHVLNTIGLIAIILIALWIGAFWLAALAGLSGSNVLGTVILGAFGFVAYPIMGIVDMLLYYDTRIRAEGYDLEHMAQSLDQAAPVSGAAPPAA